MKEKENSKNYYYYGWQLGLTQCDNKWSKTATESVSALSFSTVTTTNLRSTLIFRQSLRILLACSSTTACCFDCAVSNMWVESSLVFICSQYSFAFTSETDFLRGGGNELNGLTDGLFFHVQLARIFAIIKTNNRISVCHQSVVHQTCLSKCYPFIGLSCEIEAFTNMYVFITCQ